MPVDLTLILVSTHQHRLGTYANVELVAADGGSREMLVETFYNMMKEMMGGKRAKRYLPLIGTCAMFIFFSNMASLIGSGVMDRYPILRIGTLEAGHGWLPFWIARLDEHAETIKAALPELKQRPSDYVTSTHRGHGHTIAKGGDPRKMMAELLGRATGYSSGNLREGSPRTMERPI